MLPESRQKSESEARNILSCGCKSMTEGPIIMLGVFTTLLPTYTMPINYYCSKPTSLRCRLMAKCCLKVGRNRNLRQEICHHVAVKVWQRALEICWMCSSTYYTHRLFQTSTIVASTWLYTPTWWPNMSHILVFELLLDIFFVFFLLICNMQAIFLIRNGLRVSIRSP